MRQKDRLFVSSSICTHKRCIIERTGAGYSCDCHHSKYTPDGVPIHGPARKPRAGPFHTQTIGKANDAVIRKMSDGQQ